MCDFYIVMLTHTGRSLEKEIYIDAKLGVFETLVCGGKGKLVHFIEYFLLTKKGNRKKRRCKTFIL